MASKWSGSTYIEKRFAVFPVITEDQGLIWWKDYFSVVTESLRSSNFIADSNYSKEVECKVVELKNLPEKYKNLARGWS